MQAGRFDLIEAEYSKMGERNTSGKITFYDSDSENVCLGQYNEGLSDTPTASRTDLTNIAIEENISIEDTERKIYTDGDWIHLSGLGLRYSKKGLSSALEQYHGTKVESKRTCFHQEMSEIERKVNDVLYTVHYMDSSLCFQRMQPSCFYEVRGSNEIDVFLVLDQVFNWDNYSIIELSDLPGYVQIRQEPHTNNNVLAADSTPTGGPMGNFLVKSESGSVFLSAKAVGKRFKELVRKSFECLPREWRDSAPECKLNSQVHQLVGTALERSKSFQKYFSLKRVTLKRVRFQDATKRTVNLIPTISCRKYWPDGSKWSQSIPSAVWPDHALLNHTMEQGVHLVAMPTDKDEEDSWRIKFFDAQRLLINHNTGNEQCKLKCLRIIKVLCENHLRFSRHFVPLHLENMALELYEQYPDDSDWTNDMLPVRFLEFLVKIYRSLRVRSCCHYFMPQINLLSDIPERITTRLAEEVLNILNDPIKFLA